MEAGQGGNPAPSDLHRMRRALPDLFTGVAGFAEGNGVGPVPSGSHPGGTAGHLVGTVAVGPWRHSRAWLREGREWGAAGFLARSGRSGLALPKRCGKSAEDRCAHVSGTRFVPGTVLA